MLLATALWCLCLSLLPWTVSPASKTVAVPPLVGFWAMAAVTGGFAWAARHDGKRGYLVLTVSLLGATWFVMMLSVSSS